MTNTLTKATTTANPFAEYAAALAERRLDGRLLKFNKGDWLAGPDGDVLPVGTQLVALMGTLMVGWQRWKGQKPVETRMGLLIHGFRRPKRQELGDEDSRTWETDASGSLRDPWQYVNNLVFMSPDANEIFTFSTGSRGGLEAVGKLCGLYANAPAGVYPLVCLEVGSYQHGDRAIGRVKVPVLKVVKPVDAAPFDEALAVSRGEPAPAPAPPTATIGAPLANEGYEPGCDPDETIPF